jgi:hypothetical protein
MMVMEMVKTKLEDHVLQLGKEERKTKTKEIKANVSNRFLF